MKDLNLDRLYQILLETESLFPASQLDRAAVPVDETNALLTESVDLIAREIAALEELGPKSSEEAVASHLVSIRSFSLDLLGVFERLVSVIEEVSYLPEAPEDDGPENSSLH